MIPLLSLILLTSLPTSPGQYHVGYFERTDHRLDVYIQRAPEAGRTVLVLGGIHGNEPGAYMAAEKLRELRISNGILIVIPHTNARAIQTHLREIGVDLNRQFGSEEKPAGVDGQIVSVIKSYIAQADLLLNLHDGSGYYDPIYRSALRNPSCYGQSVIADCREFFSRKYGLTVPLQDPAETVLTRINQRILKSDDLFHFSNHETAEPWTKHPEQRKSATYYAVSHCGIPAFGVETSKNLASDEVKASYQLMVVHEFLMHYGLGPDDSILTHPPTHPAVRRSPSQLQPALSIPCTPRSAETMMLRYDIDGIARQAKAGTDLWLVRGERIRFANDPLTRVNVIGFVPDPNSNHGCDNGYIIDTGRDLMAEHSVDKKGDSFIVKLYRNKKDAGTVVLRFVEPALKSVTLETPQGVMCIEPGCAVEIPAHSRLKVIGIDLGIESGVKVNVLGYRGRGDGEDRGQDIDTDVLLPAFSMGGEGRTYPIRVTRFGRMIGEVYMIVQREEN